MARFLRESPGGGLCLIRWTDLAAEAAFMQTRCGGRARGRSASPWRAGPAAISAPCTICGRLYCSGWPAKSVSTPPASCTRRSAAARSQSWLPGEANAASSVSLRHAGKPQRQRMDLGPRLDAGRDGRRADRDSAWARRGSRRQGSPALTRIGAPFSVVPLPRAATKHLVGHRCEKRGKTRAAVLDQRHRYGPVGTAGEKGAGAVDRIDDPGARLRAAGRIVLGFFRQPAGRPAPARKAARAGNRSPRCRRR